LGHRKLTRRGTVGAICIFVVQIWVGDLHPQAVQTTCDMPGPLRLQTSPGEGILSAGDLKTEGLQFQTVRRLKSEEMAQPTAWGSGWGLSVPFGSPGLGGASKGWNAPLKGGIWALRSSETANPPRTQRWDYA